MKGTEVVVEEGRKRASASSYTYIRMFVIFRHSLAMLQLSCKYSCHAADRLRDAITTPLLTAPPSLARSSSL